MGIRACTLVVVQSLSCFQLFVTPWTAARQASLSFTISQSLLKVMSIEAVIPSNHLTPFSSCLQSFPASGSFLMSLLFTSVGQSVGASASVLPVNIQDWFPLGSTGSIFLQSRGLSSVFSSTTVQKHQSFGAFFTVQLSQPSVTAGKTIALTTRTFVGKVLCLLSMLCLGSS